MHFFFKQYRVARLSTIAAIGAVFLSSHVYADSDGVQKAEDHKDTPSIFGTQTDVAVGMGVGFDQRYMGSKDYRPIVWPAISVHRGIFFADTLRGAGAEWQSDFGLYLADALNYDVGRGTATNVFRPGSSNLTGMGEVKGTLTNTVTVAQGLATWFAITAQAEQALDGSQRGNQYQLGVESTLSITPKDTVIVDLDAKFGDRQYNQTYFGVTPSQSNNSGYAQFAPGSGVYAYFLSGNWKHSFDKNWSTQVIVTATSYTDKVAESPIVESKFGVAAFTSLNYSF
jgi:outer membrane scaffolding protein for murein synthesis (MipA/OmpV family)